MVSLLAKKMTASPLIIGYYAVKLHLEDRQEIKQTKRNEVGLKMPHIEYLIDAQRLVFIQTFLNDSPRSWKFILSYYLTTVGGKVLF